MGSSHAPHAEHSLLWVKAAPFSPRGDAFIEHSHRPKTDSLLPYIGFGGDDADPLLLP